MRVLAAANPQLADAVFLIYDLIAWRHLVRISKQLLAIFPPAVLRISHEYQCDIKLVLAVLKSHAAIVVGPAPRLASYHSGISRVYHGYVILERSCVALVGRRNRVFLRACNLADRIVSESSLGDYEKILGTRIVVLVLHSARVRKRSIRAAPLFGGLGHELSESLFASRDCLAKCDCGIISGCNQ